MKTTEDTTTITTGPAAAAFIAAGIGCAALGLFVPLAEASPAVKEFLNWWNPVGPLTGKTGMAVIIWLISWAILHTMWKSKAIDFGRAFTIALILIGLGVIGTFPTFFLLFAIH